MNIIMIEDEVHFISMAVDAGNAIVSHSFFSSR